MESKFYRNREEMAKYRRERKKRKENLFHIRVLDVSGNPPGKDIALVFIRRGGDPKRNIKPYSEYVEVGRGKSFHGAKVDAIRALKQAIKDIEVYGL